MGSCAELAGLRAGSQGSLKERTWEGGSQRAHGGPGNEESVPRASGLSDPDHEGTTRCRPPGPRPLWEETTCSQRYHHRGKGYGGTRALHLSQHFRVALPCSANSAKALFWEGTLSQAAGSCPLRAYPLGKRSRARGT